MKLFFQKAQTLVMNMNMATRLCIVYMLILIPSLFTLSAVDRNIYTKDLRSATLTVFEQVGNNFGSTLNKTTSVLDTVTKMPLYSPQLQSDMKDSVGLANDSLRQLLSSLDRLGSSEDQHYILAMYGASGRIIYSNVYSRSSYIVKDNAQTWFASALEANGKMAIRVLPGEGEYACAALRLIKDVVSFEPVGVAAISIPRSSFEECCQYLWQIPGAVAVVADERGEVLYCSEKGKEANIPKPLMSRLRSDAADPEGFVETGGYLGFCKADNNGQYKIAIYTDYKTLIAKQTQSKRLMSVIFVLVCALAMVMTAAISRSSTKPLRIITNLMTRVREGDRSVRFKSRYRDEVGMLGDSFNSMLETMDEMTNRIVAISTSKKQVEIDALQKQIHPHFIYNTLEKFRMMAVEKDDYELAELISTFGKMLRYNISAINAPTTIGQELEFLQKYVLLQNTGSAKQIRLNCNVDAQLEKYEIDKLLLQPILENAIFHGLEFYDNGNPTIDVEAKHDDKTLTISVSDNGRGMSQAELTEMRQLMNVGYEQTSGSRHVGMRNVNKRIQLHYGDDYGLRVESKEGKGTCVYLVLPYTKNGSEKKNVEHSDRRR